PATPSTPPRETSSRPCLAPLTCIFPLPSGSRRAARTSRSRGISITGVANGPARKPPAVPPVRPSAERERALARPQAARRQRSAAALCFATAAGCRCCTALVQAAVPPTSSMLPPRPPPPPLTAAAVTDTASFGTVAGVARPTPPATSPGSRRTCSHALMRARRERAADAAVEALAAISAADTRSAALFRRLILFTVAIDAADFLSSLLSFLYRLGRAGAGQFPANRVVFFFGGGTCFEDDRGRGCGCCWGVGGGGMPGFRVGAVFRDDAASSDPAVSPSSSSSSSSPPLPSLLPTPDISLSEAA
ncbi:unnamed protein product, partial [Ectocarpus sp. 8 AP-2014]